MFKKLLIANRGEIACRVATTAHRMGIKTVAVYSEADATARHVAMCDELVALHGATAADTYLNISRIIAAAKATGAEAIHPGYGFLSENELFAQACAQENIVFIGPPASAIRAMGSKSAAKTLMEKAGVPLVPGYHGENQEATFLHQQADRIGYPVLLKASAGGGGKGMRIVERSEDFTAALASCQREAKASFGDERVLIEKYLTRPRHIEIQVFADTLGNYVSLFERDCSVQRRHQKVLEEAPAPGMSVERREAMGKAAVEAARAVGYVGAGTVEFIANQDGSFYFMEMNTRLQVEHPVTEMVTGTDLVEWQCRVAFGERLPKLQHELMLHGHAIEARIYAENPEKGFLPSIGKLIHLRTPAAAEFIRDADVRIDAGVIEGDEITAHYDPMIAKLIVWGEDRSQALARMSAALAEFEVVGPSTNIAFLGRLIASQPFSTADLDTGLIERHYDELFPAAPTPSLPALCLAAVMLTLDERTTAADPWSQPTGWRMNSHLSRELSFSDASGEHVLMMNYEHDSLVFRSAHAECVITDRQRHGTQLSVNINRKKISAHVVRVGELFHVFYEGHHWQLLWRDPIAHAGEQESEAGRLTAPMPGKIVSLLVAAGIVVDKGTPLLIMEAMKMEHTISAPSKGSVAELMYAVGDQVAEGAQLLTFIHQESA
ncbi:MAG: acetyl/propionyl/methylcrotonyl-CoA carboxylase subunit alpha [bacterium]|jgi:3-methylcrotonyl-CoA carboxylase alpha subunit